MSFVSATSSKDMWAVLGAIGAAAAALLWWSTRKRRIDEEAVDAENVTPENGSN